MRFLHRRGIVHRDLKSLNILLDEAWVAKISDFGLAKVNSTIATVTGGAGFHSKVRPFLTYCIAPTVRISLVCAGFVSDFVALLACWLICRCVDTLVAPLSPTYSMSVLDETACWRNAMILCAYYSTTLWIVGNGAGRHVGSICQATTSNGFRVYLDVRARLSKACRLDFRVQDTMAVALFNVLANMFESLRSRPTFPLDA